jgi:hypothetical protein
MLFFFEEALGGLVSLNNISRVGVGVDPLSMTYGLFQEKFNCSTAILATSSIYSTKTLNFRFFQSNLIILLETLPSNGGNECLIGACLP